MTQYKEQAHVKDIPQTVVIHAIEAICEGMIQDARYNFGREAGYSSQLLVKEDEGLIYCEVRFIPYDYKFRWLVEKEKDGFLVTIVGSTPKPWFEFMTQQGEKLRGLVDTQWSAFVNFSIGYVTCVHYKPRQGTARGHIRHATGHVQKRKPSQHKKTRIG